jgi:hypothetical protein
MMNLEEAQSLVQAKLDKNIDPNNDNRCVILEEETIEREWGWVFFYQSKKYVTSGDVEDMLVGNAPYIVNKKNVQLLLTGTAYDIDHYINEYEKTVSD